MFFLRIKYWKIVQYWIFYYTGYLFRDDPKEDLSDKLHDAFIYYW